MWRFVVIDFLGSHLFYFLKNKNKTKRKQYFTFQQLIACVCVCVSQHHTGDVITTSTHSIMIMWHVNILKTRRRRNGGNYN